MTLSSRHRIRNSSPGGLRPSTLPLGYGGSPQYWHSHVDGEETFFVSFKPPRPGTEPWTLAWKAAVLTTTLGPPPRLDESLMKMNRCDELIIYNGYAPLKLINAKESLPYELTPESQLGHRAIPQKLLINWTRRPFSSPWANLIRLTL